MIIETSKRSLWGFLDGSVVKNPPAMQEIQETQVQSWGQEDPLKKEMATHSTILAWEFPCTEEHGRLQSKGSQRVRHDGVTLLYFNKVDLKFSHLTKKD